MGDTIVGLRTCRTGLQPIAAAAALLALTLPLTACGNFFVCEKASCTTTTTPPVTNTGDYVYVSNSPSGADYVAAYSLASASGALTAISGSPFYLGFVPLAMKVSPNNAFLYIVSAAGSIYLYSIGTTGALTANATDPIAVPVFPAATLDISPDGNFLFTIDQTGTVVAQYTVNTSTGALTGPDTVPAGGTTCAAAGSPVSQLCTITVSPSEDLVAVSVGTAGDYIYPYTSTSGITTSTYAASIGSGSTAGNPTGDYSLAFDQNDYLYIARTTELSSYGTVLTAPVNESNQTYASGSIPRAVTLASSYDYVYTADEGASAITGFGLSGAAVLGPMTGSPFTGPTNVSALGADNSGKYLVAAGFNASSGVQVFAIGSAGALGSAVSSEGTGTATTIPTVMALTH